MEENYSIYKFTFSDGKVYIGQTNKPVEERWRKGEGYKGQDVYVPIILDGWDNIKKEILHSGLTLVQANKLEKFYIKKFNSEINGYNGNSGGNNNHRNKKISININYDAENFLRLYLPEISKQINGNAFKLICYFYLYNNQTIVISTNQIKQQTGLSRSSFHDSFYELLNKNIIQSIDNNTYSLLINIDMARAQNQKI